MDRGTHLVATGSLGRDVVEPLVLHILIELVCRQVDGAGVAAVADHEHTGRRRAHEARWIATVTTDNGFATGRVFDDELLDERGIPRQGIPQKVLPDTQPDPDNLAGLRSKRHWLDPHVMG